MRQWIIICVFLALAGCADNPPSRAYLALSDRLEAGSLRARYHDALDDPEFAPLREHVNLTETYEPGTPPPCEDAGRDGYPTLVEKGALRRWVELRTAYFSGIDTLQVRGAETSRGAAPAAWHYETALSEALRLSNEAISDLADGKMTYCQFARRDKALAYYSKWRTLPLRGDMEAAMTGFGLDELSMYGPQGAGAPAGPQ